MVSNKELKAVVAERKKLEKEAFLKGLVESEKRKVGRLKRAKKYGRAYKVAGVAKKGLMKVGEGVVKGAKKVSSPEFQGKMKRLDEEFGAGFIPKKRKRKGRGGFGGL